MPNYAMLDSSNTVINICLWDGVTPFDPGMPLIQSDTAQIGMVWDGTTFQPGPTVSVGD